MKLTIEIAVKGDALTGGGTYQRNEELARIVSNAASGIAGGREAGFLRDINGNTVGQYLIDDDDSEEED